MNRKPPIAVIRQLRQEVGFGCPVDGCGSPYLEWHHFDPAWRVENHHNPEGMIALCTQHHPMADGGAYTVEQLRGFKSNIVNADRVKGQFHWLRNRLLALVGGVFYYETYTVLTVNGTNVIWFSRDEQGYLRLNVRMLSLLAQERAVIEDNIWMNIGAPSDVLSPPHGKELEIKYANGDYLFVKFFEILTEVEAVEKYGNRAPLGGAGIQYPITVVEVNYKIGGTRVELTPGGSTLEGMGVQGGLVMNGGVGALVETGQHFRQNPSELPYIPVSRHLRCPCGSGLRYKHCHGNLRSF